MNCKEFQLLLDTEPVVAGAGPAVDAAAFEAHAKECADCSQELSAARLSRALIEARKGEVVEPTPYFAARVAALAREKNVHIGSSFVSMWRASRVVLSSIFALIIVLFALNYAGRPLTPAGEDPLAGQYSLEQVIVDEGGQQADQALSNAQVMDSLFEPEENDGGY